MTSLSPLFTWRSAICDSDLTPQARLVGLVLSLHMSERGDSCYPSLLTIAREAGCARSTAQKALDELGAKGWIMKQSGGGNRSSRYTATVPTDGTPNGQVYRQAVGGVPAGGNEVVSKERVLETKNVSRTRAPSATPPTPRPRDPLWDTLVELFGAAPAGMERGRWNKACKSLRESGATAETLRFAAEAYRTHPSYSQVVMTPTALAANWTILTATAKTDVDFRNAKLLADIAAMHERRGVVA